MKSLGLRVTTSRAPITESTLHSADDRRASPMVLQPKNNRSRKTKNRSVAPRCLD